jgi:hypothetical protein
MSKVRGIMSISHKSLLGPVIVLLWISKGEFRSILLKKYIMLYNTDKTSRRLTVILMAIILVTVPSWLLAQSKYQSYGGVKIVVEGTSNIHDWEMNASNGTCNAVFSLNAAGGLSAMNSLGFAMAAEGLKSEHKAMDKNTYKAMNTEKYPLINFFSSSCTLQSTGGNNFIIHSHGKLTISGVTKDVELTATAVFNPADKSVSCTGSYKLKMTEYNVEPPSIMFGTIKTGNDLNIKYTLLLKAS